MALKVLRDYYAKEGDAHGKASGAGGGIIGLLEVTESPPPPPPGCCCSNSCEGSTGL